MGTVTVKLTRVITQTKEIELELEGNDEGEIDDALNRHLAKEANKYHNIEDMNWDLEDVEITDEEIIEYPEFDSEEDE